MEVTKKILICLLTILSVSFSALCEEVAYQNETEQKALKMAYNLLKVYYPNGELCVSDSIWDHDWFGFSTMVDPKTKNLMDSHRKEKNYTWSDPIYSKSIAKLFSSENQDRGEYKFVADFSEPYRNMFLCEIMPIDREIGIEGASRISIFLFKYDDVGEIIQISKVIEDID